MKRILSFFVLASVLLASSCSLKEDFKGNDSEFATISLTLGGPESSVTRAIGDGSSVNLLHYAIYDSDDQLIPALGKVIEVNKFPTTVDITLAKGQTYKIAFWAQNKSTNAYTITDGDVRHVAINYAGYNNNDESRDAFFKTIEHTVTGDIALDVVLERPFAQINLGVTAEDWADAETAGISVEKSMVKISNAASALDLFNGQVGAGTEVVYALAEIPALSGEILTVEEVAYKYLSMNYILVNSQDATAPAQGLYGEGKELVNAEFTLEMADDQDQPVVVKVDNLPVQRNWRTNVIGRMLTGDISFNISLDPIFDGEEIYPDTLEEELLFAAANGGKVTLTEDVTLTEPLIVKNNMTVNLNGKTITAALFAESNGSINEGDTDSYAFWVKSGANLTINGEGNILTQPCNYSIAVWAEGGNVTINGGHYENQGEGSDLIYASAAGNIIINGGTFKACEKQAGVSGTNELYSALNLKGDGTNPSIVVYGGSFYKFNPADNVSENPKHNFCAEGYVSVLNGDWYEVAKGARVVGEQNFKDALRDSNQDVVVLGEDLDISDATSPWVNVNREVVINGEGNELEVGNAANYGIFCNAGADVVFENIDIVSNGGAIVVRDGASVEFNGNSLAIESPSTSQRYLFYAYGVGTTITINDGVFSFEQYMKRGYGYIASGAKMYIKGGSFGIASNHPKDPTAPLIADGGEIIITGGTFGFNPTAWVADGYEAVQSGSTWTVKAK